jgi:hypothetical protein
MTTLLALVAVLTTLLTSCDDGTGPPQLNGDYDLVSIDGRPLPTATFDDMVCGSSYDAAILTFNEDSPGRVLLWRRWARSRCPFEFMTQFIDGAYVVWAGNIWLRFDAPYEGLSTDAGQGTLNDDGFEISVRLREAGMVSPPAATFLFRRR